MSSSTPVTERYMWPSSTAHCILWENQKGFVPTTIKERLLKSSMFLFFAEGRIHFVMEIAGGSILLVQE